MLRKFPVQFFFVLLLLGCAPGGNHVLDLEQGSEEDADNLLIVDCLLPGQIKKLGVGATYVTPRRPAKLTALECQNRGGDYVAYDQANSGTALKVWLPAAIDGDPVAQTYVGEIYEKGFGIPPDYVLALQWYEKAAKQGYARAKLDLGYLYERGLGVKQDIVAALNLYRAASGLNDTPIAFVAAPDGDTGGGAEQLRALKRDLEDEKQKVQALRTQMELAESEIAEKKAELDARDKKLTEDQRALDSSKQSTATEKRQLKQTEQQLSKREIDIEKRRQEVERLTADVEDYKNEIARLQAPQRKVAVAGPAIQLTNPSMINMRGAATVAVPDSTKMREIVGRVQAPAGLKTFTVNGNQESLNERGVFRVLLPLSGDTTPVTLVATDKQGKRADLEFVFQWARQSPTPSESPPEASGTVDTEAHNYALIVGNDEYTQFPKLHTAVNDAKTVADVLGGKYGFKTTTILNANRYTLLAALNRLSQKLNSKDNLLIYYAGHGELDKTNGLGYWLPVDANTRDKRKWISNNAITDIINALPAKRVLVIADSCYSGALTRAALPRFEGKLSEADRLTWLRAVAKSRARVALTSGGLQPVADSGGGAHSVFANVFLRVLQENKSILEGQRLYSEVAARLATDAAALQIGQRPRYAPIRHAGHESGEFFFFPRRV